MENNFKIEIISPEKIVYSGNVNMVTLPSYEGDMSILKKHIPLITFLRPGLIKIKKEDDTLDEFFIQDGTVEFLNDNLVILSASAINLKNLSKDFLDNLSKETQNKLEKEDINDQDRYVLNHKLEVIREIRT